MGIETNNTDFDEFANAGEVEVGKSDGVEESVEGKEPKKAPRAPKPAPDAKEPKPAASDDDDNEGDEGDDDGDDEQPRRSAKDHQIERLKREKSDLNRRLRALEGGAGSAELARRLENIEKGLSSANGSDTKTAGKAPDPTDSEKYPLGHLDDRYIEDKLEWLADQKAAKQADSVLQRQQEGERNEAVTRHLQALNEKVEDLSTKGADLYDDFQETVVDAGMRGDWKLDQPTFEACHEADNGAQILYELSQDKKEALRVSRLSPYQQMKFVQERDAELASGKKGRTKPQAGEPPKNLPRGANSRTEINPATDNLDDFEAAWKRDEKRSKR